MLDERQPTDRAMPRPTAGGGRPATTPADLVWPPTDEDLAACSVVPLEPVAAPEPQASQPVAEAPVKELILTGFPLRPRDPRLRPQAAPATEPPAPRPLFAGFPIRPADPRLHPTDTPPDPAVSPATRRVTIAGVALPTVERRWASPLAPTAAHPPVPVAPASAVSAAAEPHADWAVRPPPLPIELPHAEEDEEVELPSAFGPKWRASIALAVAASLALLSYSQFRRTYREPVPVPEHVEIAAAPIAPLAVPGTGPQVETVTGSSPARQATSSLDRERQPPAAPPERRQPEPRALETRQMVVRESEVRTSAAARPPTPAPSPSAPAVRSWEQPVRTPRQTLPQPAPASRTSQPVGLAAAANASPASPLVREPGPVPTPTPTPTPTPSPAPAPLASASPAGTSPATASPAAAAPAAATSSLASATPPPPVAAPPAPAPRPAPTPVAAVHTASNVGDEERIRTTLARWRTAYSQLDANAAQAVWPSVDVRSLEKAFRTLKSQDVRFEHCNLTVTDARARAACTGRAVYVPRIGSQAPRITPREWTFELRKADESWTIASATSS